MGVHDRKNTQDIKIIIAVFLIVSIYFVLVMKYVRSSLTEIKLQLTETEDKLSMASEAEALQAQESEEIELTKEEKELIHAEFERRIKASKNEIH